MKCSWYGYGCGCGWWWLEFKAFWEKTNNSNFIFYCNGKSMALDRFHPVNFVFFFFFFSCFSQTTLLGNLNQEYCVVFERHLFASTLILPLLLLLFDCIEFILIIIFLLSLASNQPNHHYHQHKLGDFHYIFSFYISLKNLRIVISSSVFF